MAEPAAPRDSSAGESEGPAVHGNTTVEKKVAHVVHQDSLDGEEEAVAAAYYWDNENTATYVDIGTKAWDWTRWTGAKVFSGLEFGGEVVATFFGLTRSKYDWILETKEREDQDRALRQLEKRQRKQLRLMEMLAEEKRKLHELENGAIVTHNSDILL
ncbi:hypothetical protein H310_05775 [Aphanomyces invadans]|uniref:Uncharacterized protein n=1 Tax=Aphanomyces invadans TaxID=157072 RepID=A0A024U7G2_9STRA|nr:hypothetical protein H310_05775 [Aphanomyces invadans]ETW02209.1 hypothetical protein H310_05775 [Aphanomyces invadans]|eukprot:XP_008868814.1 hypothetical protein H310_05775 [Aphanomyces invadans]